MTKVNTPAGIVAKVMAYLKLGEEGKIGSFYSTLNSDFVREVKTIKHNIAGINLEHEHELQHLDEQLEDAKKAIEDAWMDITPEQVATNALQKAFKVLYLHNIKSAEENVIKIENQIKEAKEKYKETIDDLNDQISKYEARIAKLKSA